MFKTRDKLGVGRKGEVSNPQPRALLPGDWEGKRVRDMVQSAFCSPAGDWVMNRLSFL